MRVDDILREVRNKQGDAGTGASKYTVDELIRQYKKEQDGGGAAQEETPAGPVQQEDSDPPHREETLDEIVRSGLKRYETTVKVDSEALSKTKKYRETRAKKAGRARRSLVVRRRLPPLPIRLWFRRI